MKKPVIYIFCLGTLLTTGCSSDFLNQEPPLYVEPGDIYGSQERMESAVLGLYASIKNSGGSSFLGGRTYLVFDNRGDDLENVDPNLTTLANTYHFNVGITDLENEDTWSLAYSAINNVNIFLDELARAKEVAGDKYDRFEAEAKFVRALAYFYLNNLYAKPYLADPSAKAVPLRLQPETGIGNNAKPRATVADIYGQILKDLEGYGALPQKENASEESVTRATQAAALMLRMRVHMAMGNWAEAIADGEKITGYSLTEDFRKLFEPPYYTEESIFSLPMNTTNRPNTQQGLAEYYNGRTPILVVDVKNGIMAQEHYNSPDDTRFGMKNGEGRLDKFRDIQEKLDWVPVFRYAETLLNLAECYVNRAQGDDLEKARKVLKQVRHRSLKEASDKLNIDKLEAGQLKVAVWNERRLEFIGEGIRALDVMRRGDSFERSGKKIGPNDNGYVWPIPQSEQLTNPDLNK